MQALKLLICFIASAAAFVAPVSVAGASRTAGVSMAAKKEKGFTLTSFLSDPRKSFYGEAKKEGEMEYLSGLARPEAVETLSKRFAFEYDTRTKGKVKTTTKSNTKFNPKDAKSW